ncbi:MAG TPA: glycosyltransferase family 39 protein, partial [Anaerolineae bacterium]|nr:glycosyltransferase family 39 protein [Anaerolineae bacterium]
YAFVSLVGAILGQTTVPHVIVSLRLVAALSGLLCILFTYVLAKKMYDAGIAFLGAAFLAVTPIFLRWSVSAHPDTLQVLFTIACVYCCYLLTQSYSVKNLVLASAMAGLSFGTKRVGFILVPVVLWACFLSLLGQRRRTGQALGWRTLVCRFIMGSVIAGLVFASVFIVTSPMVVTQYDQFRAKLLVEEERLACGAQSLHTNALRWLQVLAQDRVMTGFELALVGAYVVIVSLSLLRQRGRGFFNHGSSVSIVVAGATLFLLYLSLEVCVYYPRYVLPILPFLVIFASFAAFYFIRLKTTHRLLGYSLKAAVVCGVLLTFWPKITFASTFFTETLDKMNDSRVLAGQWLEANFPADTVITYDRGVYIPPQFVTAYQSYGQTAQFIGEHEPEVIVVYDAIRQRFATPEKGLGYVDDPTAAWEAWSFYSELEAGDLPCFQLVQAFDRIRIYGRDKSCSVDPEHTGVGLTLGCES